MSQILTNGKQQFIDINGKPLVGGMVFTYLVGTSTPSPTYQDPALTIANTNPVILDARGQCLMYAVGTFREVLKDSVGNIIWDIVLPDQGATSASKVTYTAPDGTTTHTVQDLSSGSGTTLIGKTGFSSLEAYLDVVDTHLSTIDTELLPANQVAATVSVAVADTVQDRNLALTDFNALNDCSNVAGKIRTIPLQSAVAWLGNTEIKFLNDSAARLRISPFSSTATIVAPTGKVPAVKQSGTALIKKISNDRWLITGDLEDGYTTQSYFAFGDSITYGSGATTPTLGYAYVLANYLARAFNNQAVPGSMSYDQAAIIYLFTVPANGTNSLMIGTNDRSAWGTTIPYLLDCFQNAHMACLVWLGVAATNKVLASSAACTYNIPGNWGTAAYGSVNTRYAATVGSTVTVPFFGPTVYLHYMRVDGKVATGEVRVDGVLLGTVNGAGPGTGTLLIPPATQGPALLRLTGLSNGPHSLELKVTVGGAGGYIQFIGISTPPVPGISIPSSPNAPTVPKNQIPRVNVLNIINTMTVANNADIAVYNNLISSNVGLLQIDGLDVVLSNANAAINQTTDMFDNLHPNNTGHAKIGRQAAMDF